MDGDTKQTSIPDGTQEPAPPERCTWCNSEAKFKHVMKRGRFDSKGRYRGEQFAPACGDCARRIGPRYGGVEFEEL